MKITHLILSSVCATSVTMVTARDSASLRASSQDVLGASSESGAYRGTTVQQALVTGSAPAETTITHQELPALADPPVGIDSLGRGYSYVHGNPNGDPDNSVDPGFRIPVIELEWTGATVCSLILIP